jgi:nicotinate-nucleotide adenylyltransferase
MMRIGIFGGTFDPVHAGHLIVAAHVHEALGLDRTVFVPAAVAPHKQGQSTAPGEDRFNMLKLAVEGNPAFDVSDIELKRGGVSYTVDTLEQLGREYQGGSLFLLIGSDNFLEFNAWKDPAGILKYCTVAVLVRPGSPVTEKDVQEKIPGAKIVHVPGIGISSRAIREKIRTSGSFRYLVPEQVFVYIFTHGLYR